MEIGQIVYLKPSVYGNAYRHDKSVKEGVVERIGRKYVTVKGFGQFEITSGVKRGDSISDYQMFESKEALEEDKQHEDLVRRIKDAIPKYGDWEIKLDKLKKIAEILEC